MACLSFRYTEGVNNKQCFIPILPALPTLIKWCRHVVYLMYGSYVILWKWTCFHFSCHRTTLFFAHLVILVKVGQINNALCMTEHFPRSDSNSWEENGETRKTDEFRSEQVVSAQKVARDLHPVNWSGNRTANSHAVHTWGVRHDIDTPLNNVPYWLYRVADCTTYITAINKDWNYLSCIF